MSIFCSLVTEDCNIFRSQSKVKTLESASQLPYRHMWRLLFFCPQLKQKPDDYINVTIELDDVDITSAETKATAVSRR